MTTMSTRGGVINFYCECCDCHQPVHIEYLQADDMNKGKPPWGDIVCTECNFVIATISAPEPGVYRFVKVAVAPISNDDLRDALRPTKRRNPWTALGFCFFLASVVVIVGTRVHHLMINSNLTEARALVFYLPMWLLAIGLVAAGYAFYSQSK